MSKWEWILKQFSAKLWLRASLFCLLGVITALAGLVFRSYIPEDYSREIGAEAVYPILNIIASSMLAVTIFSLIRVQRALTSLALLGNDKIKKLSQYYSAQCLVRSLKGLEMQDDRDKLEKIASKIK